jgi:hypothetical protein
MDWAWMGEGFSKPKDLMPLRTFSLRGRSLNSCTCIRYSFYH